MHHITVRHIPQHRSPARRRGLSAAVTWVWATAYAVTAAGLGVLAYVVAGPAVQWIWP